MATKPDPTPQNVANTATLTNQIELGKVSVLGVIGSENALSAFVRLPGGRIRQVETGDRLTRGRIVAIDSKGLVLERGGKTRRLDLPGS